MNSKELNSKEKLNLNNQTNPKICQTESKIDRIHRISPANNIKIKTYTKKKSDNNKQKDFNTAKNSSLNEKNQKIEINPEEYKKEIEKEIVKRKKIFKEYQIMSLNQKNNIAFEEIIPNKYNDTFEDSNYKNKKENFFCYIINKSWLNQFEKYCLRTELSFSNLNEDFPKPINNNDLILKDDSSLKLNLEKRIIINSNYLDECINISPELWNFFIHNYGGGPEIKIINKTILKNNNLTNEIDVIRKPVHINLIFIPKKEIISNKTNKEPSNNINDPLNPFKSREISKILMNNELKSDYKIQHIYFDITKTVQELNNYINDILNQYKNKFTYTNTSLNSIYNLEKNNIFVENINYKLWLINLELNPVEIASFLYEQINKYEKPHYLLKFYNLDKIYNSQEVFIPYLLSDFIRYKIEDIFPNKYTLNFNNKEYYSKNNEDENRIPTINIIIEEFPYHFEEPKKKYLIKKCNNCNYRDYVYSGSICNNVFYCCDDCRKQDFKNHLLSCKICLLNFVSEKNKNLYRIILGRKEYYENKKNEKQNFPILGLTNLGSSCYMNSSLQCLFATKELTDFYLYYFKEESINKKNVLGTGGLITSAYVNLLLTINNTTNDKFITPDIFRIILGLCSKQFEGNQQEDAHEFLNYMLDMLHEDINRVINKLEINQNDNSKNIKNISDEQKSLIDWNYFLKRNQSVLIDLFYGQYKSSVICPICNFKSINFNSFLGLELPIIKNKNYIRINICFVDYFKDFYYIFFYVLLFKNELNIYNLRKKISNFLEIDILEFELVYTYNYEIIHLFEISDTIQDEIKFLYAFRINPYFFYSNSNDRINEINKNDLKDNNGEEHCIDYENLESNINKRINKIIYLNDNNNDNNNNYLYLTLKYNDNVGLDSSFYQRCILSSFLLDKRRFKAFETEEIIYLKKNKKCLDIYQEVFKKYFLYIITSNFSNEKKEKIIKIYKTGEPKKKINVLKNCFSYFFKKGNFNPSELKLFENFPDCPFILFLRNDEYNITDPIPLSSHIDYNFILNRFYDKINDKKYEDIENQYNHNNIDINKNIYSNIEENILKNNIPDDNEKSDDLNNPFDLNNYDKKNENNIDNNFHSNDDDIIYSKEDNNTNDNNSNNQKDNNEDFKGLLGGDPKYNNENSENENQESENKDDEDDDDDDSSETNKNNDEDSGREIENDNDSQQDDLSLSNSNSNNESKKSRNTLSSNEDENVNFNNITKKSDKVESMDRLIIIWNRKYIQPIKRYSNINLCDLCDKIYENFKKEKITIEKCFEEFSKEEKLDKENLWKCPNCEENIEANKKIELYNIPKILIIHLKRFNNNKKINTFINFPLTNLSLNNYINNTNKQNNNYDLFGVINHFGSLQYGHYTAYCKNYHDNNWYAYNDRIVNQIPKEKEQEIIVNENAYILFYRERNNDIINWEKIYNKTYEDINENNFKKFGEDFEYDVIEINENKENEEIEKYNKENNLDDIESKKTIENCENIGIEDDNFSFKDGKNKIIIEESEKNNGNQTPKFHIINKINRIKEVENINNNNKFPLEKNKIDLNQNNEGNDKSNSNDYSDRKCQTKDKKDKECYLNKRLTDYYSPMIISKKNIIRIHTYKKIRNNKKNNNLSSENQNNQKKNNSDKEHINNDDKNTINSNISEKEKDLLQYDIFNQSKNYFKLNKNKPTHSFKSVRSKELTNFILQLYSDDVSDKIPRSKKLSEINNIKSKKRINKEIIINKKELEREKLITIKEDDNEYLKNVKENEIDLEDFVYNPFRNYFAKLMKIK